MTRPVLALTMGDPGGIGPEVLVKALLESGIPKRCTVVLVGVKPVFQALPSRLFSKLRYHEIPSFDQVHHQGDRVCFLDCTETLKELAATQKIRLSADSLFQTGRISKMNALGAWVSLEAAVNAAVSGQVQGVVTAPVNKTAMRLLKPGFHGHTEYLAAKAGVRHFAMMFVGPKLKVTLATVHVALKEVSRCLSKAGIVQKILLTDEFLRKRMKIKQPRIAVCALNPHGEETGSEENTTIKPAVLAACKLGVKASGPFSADQLFYEAHEGHYDAVISMYHDQALAPFKMISFHDGVNVTLGLPFVRTSPDHGTAFDIAYRNKAQSASMAASIRLAAQLVQS